MSNSLRFTLVGCTVTAVMTAATIPFLLPAPAVSADPALVDPPIQLPFGLQKVYERKDAGWKVVGNKTADGTVSASMVLEQRDRDAVNRFIQASRNAISLIPANGHVDTTVTLRGPMPLKDFRSLVGLSKAEVKGYEVSVRSQKGERWFVHSTASADQRLPFETASKSLKRHGDTEPSTVEGVISFTARVDPASARALNANPQVLLVDLTNLVAVQEVSNALKVDPAKVKGVQVGSLTSAAIQAGLIPPLK